MGYDIIDGSGLTLPLINSHTALSIPAYWRAMDFLSDNQVSFGRDVCLYGVPLTTPHYLDRYLKRQANQMQTSHSVFRTWIYHREHKGNGYSYIRRDPITTDIRGLYNLLPEDVTPYRLTPDDGNIFDAQIWYWHAPSKRAIHSSDILHIKGLSYDGLLGYSPCDVMANTFRRGHSLDRIQTKYLDKGTLIRGSIEVPVGTTQEQLAEIVATLRKFQGKGGDRDVIVLSGGATLKNTTITPAESQMLEQDREFSKKIAQITGCPPEHLYERHESKYNNNVEQASQDVSVFVFRTRIEAIEDELTSKLLTDAEREAGYTIKLNANALMRGNTATQMDVATKGVTAGVIDPNEARAIVGQPAREEAEANTLKRTGDTAPTPATESAPAAPDTYAALAPVIEDAINRVETKATKAFEAAAKKDGQERVIWANVFAEQQAGYAASALAPVATALQTMTGRTLDTATVGERYAAAIRKRAGGHEATSLADIIKGVLDAAEQPEQ